MQLGIFSQMEFLQGDDDSLIRFEKNSGSGVFRNSCSKCGSFCYKVLPDGAKVAPLGAMSGAPVLPTCHIFVADRKKDLPIMFPELPQHDGFP